MITYSILARGQIIPNEGEIKQRKDQLGLNDLFSTYTAKSLTKFIRTGYKKEKSRQNDVMRDANKNMYIKTTM